MHKKLYSLLMVLMTSLVLFVSCSDDDGDKIEQYSTLVDVTGSTLVEDKYSMVMKFSTDGGSTWVDYPKIDVGQKYMVKIYNSHSEADLKEADFFTFDWSGSTPAPNTGGSAEQAEFTMKENNKIVVKVADKVCTYDASSWAGTFDALEDYGSSDYGPYDLVLTQDESNPNRFHLDNFYDSGLTPYIEFADDGTVMFPDGQSPDDKPITNSTGTYDQCRGLVTLNLNYDGGDWVYYLTKQQ